MSLIRARYHAVVVAEQCTHSVDTIAALMTYCHYEAASGTRKERTVAAIDGLQGFYCVVCMREIIQATAAACNVVEQAKTERYD